MIATTKDGAKKLTKRSTEHPGGDLRDCPRGQPHNHKDPIFSSTDLEIGDKKYCQPLNQTDPLAEQIDNSNKADNIFQAVPLTRTEADLIFQASPLKQSQALSKIPLGIKSAVRQNRVSGKVHIYDGQGKGKSQVSLGLALRQIGVGIATSSNYRVLLLRFLKGADREYDEDSAIAALHSSYPHLIDLVQTGRGDFLEAETILSCDYEEAWRGWWIAKGAIASGLYSAVILDELNPALHLGLLPLDEVIDTLRHRPGHVEVVITGTDAPPGLIAEADLHSEMQPIAANIGNGIEIYTGDGKGKSTAALGKALKAIGTSIRSGDCRSVAIVQLLKGGNPEWYSETPAIAALAKAYPHLVEHYRFGLDRIVFSHNVEQGDYDQAMTGWNIAAAAMKSGKYRTVIVDELNPSVDLGLIPAGLVFSALEQKSPLTETILTGRSTTNPPYLCLASTHSEVMARKHYYQSRVELSRGIDY